jgi:hypothetical protein
MSRIFGASISTTLAPMAPSGPSGAPSARFWPASRIAILWQRSASSMKWVVTTIEVPPSTRSNSCSQKCRRDSGSTAEVGSSRNRSCGSMQDGGRERQALALAAAHLAGETMPRSVSS